MGAALPICAFIALEASAHAAPPGNDNFPGPDIRFGFWAMDAPGGYVVSTVEATGPERGEPGFHGGAASDDSVWFTWTPDPPLTRTAHLRIGRVSSGFLPVIAVYTGSRLGELVKVAEGPFAVDMTVEPDTTYRVAIAGNAGTRGDARLAICTFCAGNDDLGDAVDLTGRGLVKGTTAFSTFQHGEPATIAGSVTGQTVWYRWTPSKSGPAAVAVFARNTDFDPAVEVFAGDHFDRFTSVAANDDLYGTRDARVRFSATAGTTYHVAVTSSDRAAGPFTLQYGLPTPRNDDFYAPYRIVGDGIDGRLPVNLVRDGATRDPGEPDTVGNCDSNTSVWYTWTPPSSGPAKIRLSRIPWVFPERCTSIGLYTGSTLGTLTPVAGWGEAGVSTTHADFRVTGGVNYRIVVSAQFGYTAHSQLQWAVNAPANDDFSARQVLRGDRGTVDGTNVHATSEDVEPDPTGDVASSSVWYAWRPSISGPATFSLSRESGINGGLSVYTGMYEGRRGAHRVASGGPGVNHVSFDAVAGEVYYIQVDGQGASTGTYRLHWAVPSGCNGLPPTILGSGRIVGTEGPDVILGSAGVDTIEARGGDDVICGGDGSDIIIDGPGADTALGDAGDDTFSGWSSGDEADVYDGGAGTDRVVYSNRAAAVKVSLDLVANDGGPGEGDNALVENLIGGSGADVLVGSDGNNVLGGNPGDDTIDGGLGNDTLIGGPGNDVVLGGSGNDSFGFAEVTDGADRFDGGPGVDTANYATRSVAVALSLDGVANDGQSSEGDNLVAVERLAGGTGNDTLRGNSAANHLDGGAGNDTLAGSAGNDVLIGGSGNDTLGGGAGNDTLRGLAGDDSLDTKDGVAGNDTADGGVGTDTATTDPDDTVIAVP